MNPEFFHQKIKRLSNDKLINLLHKTNNKENPDLFELAMNEAEARNLQFNLKLGVELEEFEHNTNDKEKLRKWNWGAFFLAPIWALANQLDKWTILCFVPLVNIGVMFYLGYYGNKLAFQKSKIDSVDDFMVIQKGWERWGLRVFWVGVLAGVISLFTA